MNSFFPPPVHPEDGPEYAILPLRLEAGVEMVFYKDMRIARSLEAFSEALSMAGTGPVRRLLVDVTRVRSADTLAEQKAFAKLVQATGLRSTDRLAGVIAEDERGHDPILPAMVGAGYMMKLFTDREIALQWLGSTEG